MKSKGFSNLSNKGFELDGQAPIWVSMQIVALVLLSTIFYLNYAASPLSIDFDSGYLRGVLREWINNHPLAGATLGGSVLILAGFWGGGICRKVMLYRRQNYLMPLFFAILCYGVRYPVVAPETIVVALIIVMAICNLLSTAHLTESFDSTFKSSFLFGLIPLFNPSLCLVLIFIPMAMRVTNRGWRESTVAILSMLLPVAVWGCLEWMLGGDFLALGRTIIESHSRVPMLESGFFNLTITEIVVISIVVLIAINALIVALRSEMRSKNIRFRLYYLIVALFLATMASTLFAGSFVESIVVVAAPLSLLLPVVYVKRVKIVATILYVALFVAVVINIAAPLLGWT